MSPPNPPNPPPSLPRTPQVRFYRRFTGVFGLWISLKVVIGLVSGAALDDNIRAKYVAGWEVATLFVGQLLLVLMYQPKASFNTGFPFHGVSSVMLGLVQGQSASDFLRDQGGGTANSPPTPLDNVLQGSQPDSGSAVAPPVSLNHAKGIMKSAGIDLHRTLGFLAGASEDLLNLLRDLDDYDGQDVSFVNSGNNGGGGGGEMGARVDYAAQDLDR